MTDAPQIATLTEQEQAWIDTPHSDYERKYPDLARRNKAGTVRRYHAFRAAFESGAWTPIYSPWRHVTPHPASSRSRAAVRGRSSLRATPPHMRRPESRSASSLSCSILRRWRNDRRPRGAL